MLSKQTKMLPPLEHYMKPTYYDVIYMQNQSETDQSSSKFLPPLNMGYGDEVTFHGMPKLEMNFNFDKIK